MKIVQATLRSEHGDILTTWLDSRPNLKKGVFVTLKDFKPDVQWIVEEVYEGEHEAADFDWHRKWDNNI